MKACFAHLKLVFQLGWLRTTAAALDVLKTILESQGNLTPLGISCAGGVVRSCVLPIGSPSWVPIREPRIGEHRNA